MKKISVINKVSFLERLKKDIIRNKGLYLLLVPVVVYYIVFHYYPMYGAQIAFKNYSPAKGIEGSSWVGFDHFKSFFSSIYCERLIKNTLLINIKSLVFGFPAPILLALLLNEVKNIKFKKVVQTISYLPHFISAVVLCGMIRAFCGSDGFITSILTQFGFLKQNLLYVENLFQPIYVISGIWQGIGWGSIIYLAAISGINGELYEAARIDGAGRLRQVWHVTIPGILPTIITMLVLRIGNLMNLGYEKIMLLYNSAVYETADVISTYVYRKGLMNMNYSFSTAVGLFNSCINLVLLISANKISKKLTDSSLW